MWRLKSKSLAVGVFLLLAIGLSAVIVYFFREHQMTTRVYDGSELAAGTIVGEWVRIGKGSDTVGRRVFADSGDFSVRYGDVIIEGRYRVLGPKLVETRDKVYGQPDKVYTWTFGFEGTYLVMVNQETGWVEEYRPATNH